MTTMKRYFALLLAFVTVFGFASCGKKEPNTVESEFETVILKTTEEETTEEEVVVPTLPENMNPLTGLECDPALKGKRPIGVMFNNIKAALPQVGLSKCDIIYEVLAEGGITRFEGLIHEYANAGNLGSVRSSRPYYVNLARAYDALYIHAGGSDLAYSVMNSSGIDHFDGVKGNFYVNGELLFWRDQGRLNSGYSLEHTMFVSGNDIAQGVIDRNIRSDLKDQGYKAFNFDPAFAGIGSGQSATYIKIPQSYYYVSEFNYDAENDVYLHSHYGTKHIDGATGEQIKTTNVFVLFTAQRIIDNYGCREVTLTGEGSGYYFNGGEYVSLTWKRANDDAPFQYFAADGSELKVEQGKSYVALVDQSIATSLTIS